MVLQDDVRKGKNMLAFVSAFDLNINKNDV